MHTVMNMKLGDY